MLGHEWLSREDGDVDVPPITDKVLKARLARLTPLVVDHGHYYTFEIPHLRNTAFTWDPKIVHCVEFEPLMAIYTDHGCGYHAFFKPSIAEVLAQVPDDLPEGVNAFCIDKEDMVVGIYASGSGHRAVTQFGRLNPSAVKRGPRSKRRPAPEPVLKREKAYKDPHAILDEVLKR